MGRIGRRDGPRPDGAHVIVLGINGGPGWYPDALPAGVGSAVVAGGRTYVVDVGDRVPEQYMRANPNRCADYAEFSTLAGVFLTHLHSDQIIDLFKLFDFGWWNGFGEVPEPVVVRGPGRRRTVTHPHSADVPGPFHPQNPLPGTVDLIEGLFAAHATDINDRQRDNGLPELRPLLAVEDLVVPGADVSWEAKRTMPTMDPFLVHEDSAVRVTAIAVDHFPMYPALAYRFDTDDGSVVISGDTGPSENLVTLAGGADVLLHEVIDDPWIEQTYGQNPGVAEHLRAAHTPSTRLGALAERAGVATLVLNHLVPSEPPLSRFLPARKGFSGTSTSRPTSTSSRCAAPDAPSGFTPCAATATTTQRRTTVHQSTVTTPPSALGVTHPLDLLTHAEISAARAILEEAGLLREHSRFPRVMPMEPPKSVVLAHADGDDAFDRSLDITLLDTDTAETRRAVVSVTEGTVRSVETLNTGEHPYGQAQYLFEEYDRAAEIVKADPRWHAAMRRRGIEDTTHTFVAPLAPGFFPREDETGKRMIRSLTFHRRFEGDSPWGHPVEGLIAHVDLTAGEVVRLEDDGDVPVPMADANYTPEHVGPARSTLEPLEIIQPQGPSFQVDGAHVTWQNWKLRIGFTAQEGLVLHQVSFRDDSGETPEDRSVLYRASVPEMVVPYGDTTSTRFWISYFDAGEYLLGKNANSLKLGCDCLGVIKYFDAYVADDEGHPMEIPHAVCMHEEDYGVLWKHTEPGEAPQVRRSRRLVISSFVTIGNYDYGFFWYFYLDGSIQVEAKATGIVFAGACEPGRPNRHAPEIAPGLMAPVHQHIFCARLDVAVDGLQNCVQEENVVRIPMGEQNPYGNAFTWSRTDVTRESEGVRDANSETGRRWFVTNPGRRNHVGEPTAYHLIPMPGPRLLAAEGSSVWKRAQFATHHLWVTRFDDGERFPAGDFPNQHAGGGLGEWVQQDRSLVDEDVVLWHTFGPTHIPRTEDWPVMPVDNYGFWFKPYGFLDRNPALDLPDWSTAGGTCCGTEVGHADPVPVAEGPHAISGTDRGSGGPASATGGPASATGDSAGSCGCED